MHECVYVLMCVCVYVYVYDTPLVKHLLPSVHATAERGFRSVCVHVYVYACMCICVYV
jgi:hypothetical protein